MSHRFIGGALPKSPHGENGLLVYNVIRIPIRFSANPFFFEIDIMIFSTLPKLKTIAFSGLCALSLMAIGHPGTAQAQQATQDQQSFEELEKRRAALFRVTLNNPTNLDVAFEYAMLSARVGDYEGAISTLERMLIYAPGLPRVQLELAVLYYRLGAYDKAKEYLQLVSEQDLPHPVRVRVSQFEASLEQASRPFRFTGTVQAGLQTHTNANLAPNQDSILIGGLPFVLSPGARAQSDTNAFALVQLHFAHELPSPGALFEVEATLYATEYADLNRLNMNLLEIAAGPSFSLGGIGWDKTRLGLYGIVGAARLGGHSYSTTFGAGARLRSQVGERTFLEALIEGRDVEYDNSTTYPTATNGDGETYRAKAKLTQLINSRLSASLTFEARKTDAATVFNSSSYYSLSANTSYKFNGPTTGIFADDAPWTLSLSVGGLKRDYDGPDPAINPLAAESDDALWIEAGLSVPLENKFSAYITAQYLEQDSNYATRDYHGATLTFGVAKRF
jgi:hypothetical protein